MILTENEIETLIKKRKVKMISMPDFIRDLLVEQLEDSDNDAFLTGKEEGRAELQQEIEDNETFVDFEDPDFSHTLFAMQVNTIEDLKDIKQWLALQECRTMPIKQQGKLF
mgnify:CR=1 FL=1